MKTRIVRLGFMALFLAVTSWLIVEAQEEKSPAPGSQAETPLDTRIVTELQQKIELLERRIQLLEKQVEDRQLDDDWRSRTLGNRVVNGSRVYVVPLSYSSRRETSRSSSSP